MRGSAALRAAVAPGGALAGPWVKNELWRRAKAVPSLDLRFADNKSLVDATTGAQLVTFTRASSATYVDSEGVIRPAVTNLRIGSENIVTPGYAATNSTLTLVTAASPIPGLNTVTKFALNNGANTGNSSDGFNFTSTNLVNSEVYTQSIFVKSDGANTLRLRSNVTGQVFDIPVAGPAPAPTGTITAVSFTPVGDGWSRISWRFTTTTTAPGNRMDHWAIKCEVNDGIGGLLITGAQLEQSSSVGEYVPTTSTINSAPRFDHNPVTGESLGLLVEEARTNSIRNNTMVGAVAGTPGTAPTNWSITTGGTTTEVIGSGIEDGIAYVDIKFSGTSTGDGAILYEASTQVAAVNAQAWTVSHYIKIINGQQPVGSTIRSRLILRNSGGGYLTENNQTFALASPSDSFKLSRVAYPSTLSNASVAFVQPGLLLSWGSGATVDITLRIGLPQLELGAFATSVIPTTTAAATRSADVASISGSNFSSWYRQDGQTWLGEYAPVYNASATVPSGTPHLFQVYTLAAANNLYSIRGAVASTAQENFGRNSTVGLQFVSNSGVGFGVAGSYRKVAMGIDPATIAAVTNNGTVNNQINTVAALMAAHDFIAIGTGTTGSSPQQVNGHIRRLTHWPTRLGNEVLQRITQ